MKKFLSFLKIKKEDEEEAKESQFPQQQEEEKDYDASTKDKDSGSDDQSRDAKLEEIRRSQLEKKIKRFEDLLCQKIIDLNKLRGVAWNGVPQTQPHYRCTAWRLLMDYQPADQGMAVETLRRKRQEYTDMVEHYFGAIGFESVQDLLQKKEQSAYEKKNLKQIRIDVYRTHPDVKLFASQQIQVMMIRILFACTMRHPASGYVQGINDLVAPILLVFLTEYVPHPNQENIYDLCEKDLEEMDPDNMIKAEADAFWCLSKLIDDIQDNYTELQPGIHKIINKMKKLIEQKDLPALEHLEELEIHFMDFAYRWVNCYLTREFNIYQTIRLWDTYFSEEEGFSQFHSYVCAALFLQFSQDLKKMEYQDALLFLQKLPTNKWGDDDLNILMAKSYEMKQLYYYSTHLHS